MRIVVDQTRCQGHGRCAALAPNVFALDDMDGLASVTHDPVPAEFVTEARTGEAGCPERAISIEN